MDYAVPLLALAAAFSFLPLSWFLNWQERVRDVRWQMRKSQR